MARATTSAVALSLLAATAIWAGAGAPANAALSEASLRIGGPGVRIAGREASISLSFLNTSTDPAVTPEVIDRLSFRSRIMRVNGNARSVTTCGARVPKNGDAARCPRGSRIGTGSFAGLLGVPGEPVDKFGALSSVAGKLVLYNYERRGREQARMLAVITSTKPFAGVAINLKLIVSRKGELSVDVPDLAQLPRIIRNAYPKGTRVVLTDLAARIPARRERSGRPFVWLRSLKQVHVDFEAIGG